VISHWDDREAARCANDLALRCYTSRLLGRDRTLVLHGGGNTSVKLTERNILGEDEEIIYVKGSGWDLETIEAAGFAPVKLDYVRRLASLPSLSDPQMVNELATHTLRSGAPAPSIETILHAILPHKYVDHTHADAVLSVSNAPDGEKRIRDIYGAKAVVIPYIMAGFDLAAYCAREFPKQAAKGTVGMVLLSHGVFSFAEDARESYELMIELVSMAERYLAAQKAWSIGLPPASAPAFKREEAAKLRHEVSRAAGFPMLCVCNDAPSLLAFARHPEVNFHLLTHTQRAIRREEQAMLGNVHRFGRLLGRRRIGDRAESNRHAHVDSIFAAAIAGTHGPSTARRIQRAWQKIRRGTHILVVP